MSYTQTLIMKLAMGQLGDRDISDASDIYDQDAVTLKTRYVHARNIVYLQHDWKWAKRDAELQRLPTEPDTRFTYAYALPPSFARICNVARFVDMTGVLDDRDFDIANGTLRSNEEYVFMDFVANDWSEAQWPSYFADCVSVKLAEVSCLKITHDRGLKAQLAEMYQKTTLPMARSTDSTAQPFKRKLVRSEWQERRFGQGFTNLRRP
jgi:hypothetical protein